MTTNNAGNSMSNPNPHRPTPEQAAKGRETNHLTRKWYKATLLAIFTGEVKCSSTQLKALETFAEQRGWFGPQRKTKALADKKPKLKPSLTDDLVSRLPAFVIASQSATYQNSSGDKQKDLASQC
jgi:hypothetical protein